MLVSAPVPAAVAGTDGSARVEPLLRTLLGAALRGERVAQRRTLRDVSKTARVSLGYLSEIERGQKEASSELLAAICTALDIRLLDVLHAAVTESLESLGAQAAPVSVAVPGSRGVAGSRHLGSAPVTVPVLPVRGPAGQAHVGQAQVVDRAA